MTCKILIFAKLFLCSSILYCNSLIYEYYNPDEFIDEMKNTELESSYQEWNEKDIFINFTTDLKVNYDDKIFLQYRTSNFDLRFHNRAKQNARLFTSYKNNKIRFAFGSFMPSFALGNIYKKDLNVNFKQKVSSNSQFDLSGALLEYLGDNLSSMVFYSNSKLNFESNHENENFLVYEKNDKNNFEQYGILAYYTLSNFKLGLMYSYFANEVELQQFSNRKTTSLISTYYHYKYSSFNLQYENNYQFRKMCHNIEAKIDDEEYNFTCSYKKIPSKSLSWLSSGLTNKYNANTEITSINFIFPIYSTSCSLFSQLKSNHKINQWSNRSYIELTNKSLLKYRLTQEIYQDYQAHKNKKITHRISTEIMSFKKTKIDLSYLVNNKKEVGFAHKYVINYRSDTFIGRFNLSCTFLDNYRNEEILEDVDQNILASFYSYSDDIIFAINYQSNTIKNTYIKCKLLQSLNNNKLNSVKIELNYLL